MTSFPEPDQTPDGPVYEGRPLVRPDEGPSTRVWASTCARSSAAAAS